MNRTRKRDGSKKFGIDRMVLYLEREHGLRNDKAIAIAQGMMKKIEEELLNGRPVMLRNVASMKLVRKKEARITGAINKRVPERMGLKVTASEGLIEKANRKMLRSPGSVDVFHLAGSMMDS